MSLFKSGNPTLSENKFRDTIISTTITDENAMTIKGTLNKFGFMLLMLMGTAFYSWKEASNGGANTMGMIWGGVIGGFIIALVLMFKREWSPYLAPLYALLEGLFIGAISSFFNAAYPGIVIQAVGLTFSQAWLAWEIWNEQKGADLRVETLGVILGLSMTFVLSTISGFMLGGNQPPSGQGIPIVGWHLYKDIRPAHFLSVHAQQLIPLWGLIAAKFMGTFSTAGLLMGAFLYVMLWGISTWLSLQ